MTTLEPTAITGRRITVAGLGRFGGGVAVARWLVQQGATVTVTDSASAKSLSESIAQLDELPIRFRFEHQSTDDFTNTDLVVASPAIPPTNALLQAANSANVPITTEIELFLEHCPAPVFGITGTKGKSTTTAMLGRMLQTLGPTWIGGNIGKSLLADLPNIRPDHRVVLELSSYMLHYLGLRKWSPHVAVVTLLSSDHLDWHGSAEAYRNAKRNILRYQSANDIAVLNATNPPTAALSANARGKVLWFGDGSVQPFTLNLPGQHNQLNAQAAFAAAQTVGVSFADAQIAIEDFTGLPHRLQRVCERDGVNYVNDSIATIPEAAVAALNAFAPGTVIQIVGGSKKKDPPIEAFCQALASRAKAVLCIGETGPKIAAQLRSTGYHAHDVGTLESAITTANQLANPGDTVLLSPGYASYDQYANFEKRGEAFERLAKQ